MSRADVPSRAFLVAREGGAGVPVIAPDAWTALGHALRDAGLLEGLAEARLRATSRGLAATVDGVVFTVREHVAPAALDDDVLDGAADVAAACERALDAVLRAVEAESAAVLLLERRFLRFVAVRGPNAETLLGLRLPSSSGLAGYVLQTERPLLVGDAVRHPRHDGAIDALTGYRTRQVLGVPLPGRGAVHGVLELINPPSDRPFGPDDRRRAEDVARVLGDWLGRRATG